MKTSESIQKISKALVEFQKVVKNPENAADNPFFKSKYAQLAPTLTVVRPLMAQFGLSHIQFPVTLTTDGKVGIITVLLHESGEYIEGEPFLLSPIKNDPQAAGSAISYARRYSLFSILGIAGDEDDDGNVASGKQEKGKGQQKNSSSVTGDTPLTFGQYKGKSMKEVVKTDRSAIEWIANNYSKQDWKKAAQEVLKAVK